MRYAMLSAMVSVGVCVAATQGLAQEKMNLPIRVPILLNCHQQEDAIAVLEAVKESAAAVAVPDQVRQFQAQRRCSEAPIEGRVVARVHSVDGIAMANSMATGTVLQVRSGSQQSGFTYIYILMFEPERWF